MLEIFFCLDTNCKWH